MKLPVSPPVLYDGSNFSASLQTLLLVFVCLFVSIIAILTGVMALVCISLVAPLPSLGPHPPPLLRQNPELLQRSLWFDAE